MWVNEALPHSTSDRMLKWVTKMYHRLHSFKHECHAHLHTLLQKSRDVSSTSRIVNFGHVYKASNWCFMFQEPVKIPGGAAAAAAGLTKPTRYHYYPHNQHIYLLPECAIQQVRGHWLSWMELSSKICVLSPRHDTSSDSSITIQSYHYFVL